MNLHNTAADQLCRRVWAKRKEWGNQKLTDEVFEAVRDGQYYRLVDLIDELVEGVKKQREIIMEQELEIQRLKEENSRLVNSGNITPPAKKVSLDVEEMKQLYRQYNSLRKVGELMGCDGKTVKSRLKDAGVL